MKYPDILQDTVIEHIFADAHHGSTIGLDNGNIAEIKRFIMTARGNTQKRVGKLQLFKNALVWWEN